MISRKLNRLRALDGSDRGVIADVQLHFALEVQLSLHHRAGADNYTRRRWDAEEAEVPAVVFFDHDVAVDVGVRTQVDVSLGRIDVAADVSSFDVYAAVDVG